MTMEWFEALAVFATLYVLVGASMRGFGVLDRLAVIWLVIVAIFVLALNRMSMVDTFLQRQAWCLAGQPSGCAWR